ncbi:MAG: PAS domain S-box protein [Sedimenticola sp.]
MSEQRESELSLEIEQLKAELEAQRKANEILQHQLASATTQADSMLHEVEEKGEQLNRSAHIQERLASYFKRVMDAAPGLIFVLDARGRISQANAQAARTLGCSEEQCKGQVLDRWFELTETQQVPDLPWEVHSGLFEIMRRQPFYRESHRFLGGIGERYFQVESDMLYGLQGQLEGMVVAALEITENLQREQALRQSEERIRTIMDSLPVSVALLDGESNIIRVNQAWTHFSRENEGPEPLAQGVGYNYLDICRQASGASSEEADEAACGIERVLDGSLPEFTITYPCHSDTKERWFHMSVLPLEGDRRGGLVVHSDISDLTKLNRALSESEKRFLDLADHMRDVFWVTKWPENQVDYVSPAFEDIWGVSVEALYENAMLWVSAIHPDERERVAQEFLQGVETGSFDHEFRIVRPDGEVRWIHDRGEPVKDDSGEVHRVVGVARDITERKLAELELASYQSGLENLVMERTRELAAAEQESRKLADIIRAADDSIIITDRDGCIEWVNEGFCRLTGYQLSEVEGKRPGDFLQGEATDESARKALSEGVRACRKVSAEIINYNKWGDPYWVELSVQPLYDKEGSVDRFFSIATDITARKIAEENLHTAKIEAESANRAKSAFLATMSHEIRTPLNGVVGMVDVLSRSELSPGQKEIIGTVQDSAITLQGIIDDILDFSKIEAGRLELESVPLSVEHVVEGVADTLAHMALSKGIELLINCDPTIPGIRSDPVRLRQVLFNLAGNAIKFTGSQGGTVGQVVISAQLEASDSKRVKVLFKVQDNGIGMSPETQARLFQPFVQGEASTTRRFGGTGLGLTICKRLVEAMGGDIEVDSVEGEGSTFRFSGDFPAGQVDQGELHFDLRGLELFLLSRNPMLAGLLETYLQCAGGKVQRVDELSVATTLKAVDDAEGEPTILVIDNPDVVTGEMLRSRFRASVGFENVRYVEVARGRRRIPRQLDDDTVQLDLNAMHRKAFLRAVAAAASRASLEAPFHEEQPPATDTIRQGVGAGRIVLVAEDNKTNQKVLTHQLNMLGFIVVMANNGREALLRWREERPSLLLTDCHMPVMDGYELTRNIRVEEGEAEQTPILAITADALKGTAERCFDSGMNDYLAKPVRIDLLRELLMKWLPKEDEDRVRETEAPGPGEVQREATDVVDPGSLIEVLGSGDPAVLAEFYLDFIRNGANAVADIQESYASRQAEQVGRCAHRLKSSARTVGAHVLADCCLVLEQAGKAGDWKAIDDRMRDLPGNFRAVREWVDELSVDLGK